ncbi:MAG: hypothetical protein ACI84K_000658 [Pseudohongiellaceae bacterium]|jgi:hypothetical protein
MSGTTITFIIFGAVCFFIGLVYLSQMRERARIEKIRKTNSLTERHNRMQLLLHELPPQYLNNELRIMISERSIEAINELSSLKGDDRLKQKMSQEQEFLTQLREKNPKFKPVIVQNEAKAKDVRVLLESLSRFVQNLNKRKRLDANSTKKYLNHIEFSIGQSKADLFTARAEAANKAGKPRVAIHNYHNAIDAFKALSNNPQATKTTARFKTKIKELEQSAQQPKGTQAKTPNKPADNSSEWDSFMKSDDEDWQKKKNDYE